VNRNLNLREARTLFAPLGGLLVFVGIAVFLHEQWATDGSYWRLTLALILGFFAFNLIVRRRLSFRGYFTSAYNLLTAKKRAQITFDWPRELLFDKVIEVLEHSKFRLAETERAGFKILATTGLTLTSWGENLYIDLEQKDEETVMHFCSTTLFQIYSWEKNDKNFRDLMDEIERSLTI